MRYTLGLLLAMAMCAGCTQSGDEQRKIEFVKPVVEHNTPSDSLMMDVESMMQNYAALMSRAEKGEQVEAQMMALRLRAQDLSMKMEMLINEMSPEEFEYFTARYDSCLSMMGVADPAAVKSTTTTY